MYEIMIIFLDHFNKYTVVIAHYLIIMINCHPAFIAGSGNAIRKMLKTISNLHYY